MHISYDLLGALLLAAGLAGFNVGMFCAWWLNQRAWRRRSA